MPERPIFVATHPRACSTAFERVFMTRPDVLKCIHEPFGDAYYYGPERLAERFAEDDEAREESGFDTSTFQTIMKKINDENTEGKRLFIKDMAQYLIPPSHGPVSIAPSLLQYRKRSSQQTNESSLNAGSSINFDRRGSYDRRPSAIDSSHLLSRAPILDRQNTNEEVTPADRPYPTKPEYHNPTVAPKAILQQFHFAFLIRHPKYSIPSYYRCTVPPLEDLTGFHSFRPDEAGYDELRRSFDYLREVGIIGPNICGRDASKTAENGGTGTNGTNGTNGTSGDKDSNGAGEMKPPKPIHADICVIDADDLLDDPERVVRVFCKSVGIEFTPDMLRWDTAEDHEFAEEAFAKWKGFHEDAINSTDLKPRQHKKVAKTDEDLYNEWVQKFGEEAAEVIKVTVEENIPDYEYLKQFKI